MNPKVSVICLCYNHAFFLKEAIESVLHQTYDNLQIIVMDNASTDNSVALIRELKVQHPHLETILLSQEIGYCKAFNAALKLAKGDFIIDFATDDILLPDRVAVGVELLTASGPEFGVQFSDAEIISEQGVHQYYHSSKFPHNEIPQGDIYRNLISHYFICSPTMMFTKKVTDTLNGYDETLAFEDFDMWIRASREFKFCYSPKVLVKKRLVTNSMSRQQFTRGNEQRWSTLKVCWKIKELNKSADENAELKHRCRYEFFVSLKMGDFKLAKEFSKLYWQV